MKAKQILKAAGFTVITPAGFWQGKRGMIPVVLIQKPCGAGITVGGDKRQRGAQMRAFARTLA